MAGAPERQFLFNRASRDARSEETLLSALTRGRFPVVQRSIRYHRPRGPVCGVGYCTGCLVRVNGRPNVRACRYLPSEGDVVTTENSWPSPRFDVLGLLDFLFPGGIDTLHGFRRPAWAVRSYHRVVRRLAGYGTVPDLGASASLRQAPVRRTVDVAIVGGGAAGTAVAQLLVQAGRHPLVLDRQLVPPSIAGVDVAARTTVTFLPPPTGEGDGRFALLGFEEPARGVEIHARHVVVATGGYDASLLFGGNDRPGVVTADGAFGLLDRDGRPPFERAVVVGGGPRADRVLERVGDAVVAVVAPGGIDPSVVRRASEQQIPLYPRSLVVSASGRSRVRSLALRARGSGARFTIPCDAVVLAHRRLPTPQLFFQVGARMEWRAGTGAYYPVLSDNAETTVPGVFAVGATAGILPEGFTESCTRVTGTIAGSPTNHAPELPRGSQGGPSELEGYYRELWREPRTGRWIACPCEDVLLDEVEDAARRGYRGIEVVKRYTGLGTGLCQGRYCLPDALLILSLLEERPPPEVGYITQRPPVVPTPLAAFAAMEDPAAAPGGS
ncbi:MAG: 2Fe-2S iron-sulfur cluster-binding protein [Thermoplasmata archaeon]|nr:2Fe-2S iron-sulfur cluster-binding protein [Thermoplasmata archaeon]